MGAVVVFSEGEAIKIMIRLTILKYSSLCRKENTSPRQINFHLRHKSSISPRNAPVVRRRGLLLTTYVVRRGTSSCVWASPQMCCVWAMW